MPSTYSTNLKIELPAVGEQSGIWNETVNNNLGTLIEQAISGYVTQAITDGADTTIMIPDGATGVARNMYLELTGALSAARNLIVPANKKLYFIYNNTTGGYAVTVKVSGQTGIAVPAGKKCVLVCNGTDVVEASNYTVGAAGFGAGATFNGAVSGITTLTASGAVGMAGLYSVRTNGLMEIGTNGVADVPVNYAGYNEGTTQFRNFKVYDGKNALLFGLTGSTGAASFGTNSLTAGAISGTSGTFSTTLLGNGDLRVRGENTANVASTLVASYEGSGLSRINAYGVDNSTQGSLEIRTITANASAASAFTFSSTGLSVTGDIYTTAWTDWSASAAQSGWAATPTTRVWYRKTGKQVTVSFSITGTSNATGASISLPVAASNNTLGFTCLLTVTDNDADQTLPGLGSLPANSATLTFYKTLAAAAWTGSGAKTIVGTIIYESV